MSEEIRRKVTDYLESKNRSPLSIDDIDTAIEYYAKKPMLTAHWWQVFLKNTQQEQPQHGVYFVAGQMLKLNDKKIHKTENIVEKEKLIVVPIDNWISLSPKRLISNKKKVEKVMTALAKERMDRVTRLTLEIDGNLVQSEPRIISPLFEIKVDKRNIETLTTLEVGTVNEGKTYFAMSDGYWLFIEPDALTRGPHIIKTFGSCATGALELQMHHSLHII